MKKIIISFLVAFNFHSSAFCGISSDKIHLQAKGKNLVCEVDFGFHFNTKAPTSLEVGEKKYQPNTKEEKKLSFNLSAAGSDRFRIHFYVCDDALTICEPHDYDMQISDGRIIPLASHITDSSQSDVKLSNTKQSGANEKSNTGSQQPNENGFFENQFETSLAQAKKEGKILLVDFRAPWCPACLRLETETFNQKVFQTATKKYVKLSLNIDLDQNKPIADHFSVKAIPTLILMSPEQIELYRSLDFKTARILAKELSNLKAKDLISDEELMKLAETKQDQKAIWILAKRNSDAMKYQDALIWFKKLKTPNPQQRLMAAAAEIGVLADLEANEANEKLKISTYEKNIRDFSDSFDAVVWRNELSGILNDQSSQAKNSAPSDEVKTLLKQNIEKINIFLAKKSTMLKAFENSYQGDFSGFEKAELLNQKIESEKNLSAAKEVENLKLELAQDIHSRTLTIERTGELLMAISYLKASDQKTEVLEWYQKLIAKSPESFVYYAKLANYQHELKDDEKALAPAEKAVALGSELAFRNLKLLAQIQKALNKNQDAMKSIDRALALPDAKVEKNKKYAEALAAMKKTLSK